MSRDAVTQRDVFRDNRRDNGGRDDCGGSSIREIALLRKQFGRGRWRKLKGVATVRLPSGRIRKVELHWYEAHGVGKRKLKIKSYLD
jgi:hypothetical protein